MKAPPVVFTPEGLIDAARATLELIEKHGEDIANTMDPALATAIVSYLAQMATAEATLALAMMRKEETR
jgi:hypothetical protein